MPKKPKESDDRNGWRHKITFIICITTIVARQAEVENDQVIGFGGALVGGIAAIGQPVKAGNTDKDAEAFVDREIVGKGHQLT